jgi:ATP-dependent DNA ligase
MTTLPTLYSCDKSNEIREWNIHVQAFEHFSMITIKHGVYQSENQVIKEIKIDKGKNIGKKNETTHYDQAIKDMYSKWNKKKKINGYQDHININDNIINNDKELIKPMLAHPVSDNNKKYIQYPCYVQPKLDGYRAIFDSKSKKFYSRTGQEYEILYQSPIFNELVNLTTCKNQDIVFDGEIYVHGMPFEEYGILRKKKVDENDLKKLQKYEYHIYDIIMLNQPYHERMKILRSFKETDHIKIVTSNVCKNWDEIVENHDFYLADNYEGSIIRNAMSEYEIGVRSYHLLKYKTFQDDEFEIVGYTSEKWNDHDLIIWICKLKESESIFYVQSSGTREHRMKMFQDAKNYIGRKLWVKFFGYTSDGIPRFAKTMRNDISCIRDEVV